jgi:hypothetical protein
VSWTSCYRYIIELPAATLSSMITSVLKEGDSAGVKTSLHQDNVPISGPGGYHATVDANLTQLDTNPPTIDLTATDLGFVLHLRMSIQVKVIELPNLDAITYLATFDFPGTMVKDTTVDPPVLNLTFPAVNTGNLNLAVSGGTITLTPELIAPKVHDLYQAHPELAHQQQSITGVPLDGTWLVTTDIYDDDPMSPGFRGQITVEVPDATHIKLNLPGHLKAQTITDTRIDTDITIHVAIPVQQTDGLITVQLSTITAANTSIDYASPNLYTTAGDPVIRDKVAQRLAALGDLSQSFPDSSQVKDAIASELINYALALKAPLFKGAHPANPADPSQMDLSTFVPTTVNQQVLALQIEPLGTPCDTPDVFTGSDPFAVSVSQDRVNPMLQQVVTQTEGTTQHVSGHDVDVHDMTAVLSDPGEHGFAPGHIWIAGIATVHIDCWPDPDIHFSGPLTLTAEMQTDGGVIFHGHAGHFNADNPKCASVNPDEIASAIEAASNQKITGLPSDFAGVGHISITVGPVDISRQGVIIRGTLTIQTLHQLNANQIQQGMYWYSEPAGGG